MRTLFALSAPLFALACSPTKQPDSDSERYRLNWEGGDQLLAEVCPKYAPEGYEFLSMRRAKFVLQDRYEGERLTAHFIPNTLYCSFRSKQQGKDCYNFFDVNISPGGGIGFCVDKRTKEIVDLVLEQ